MGKAVVIAGSEKDEPHVTKIRAMLQRFGVDSDEHYLSAHKNTQKVLDTVERYNQSSGIVFITVAGKSNALSGVVACNTKHPVIACPPFATLEDYMIDIHSTLRMPSECPVLVVISPENCALAVKRIMEFKNERNPRPVPRKANPR